MIALTTPAVVAIAVHWEVLCLLIVMIVGVTVVDNSLKEVDPPGLVVVIKILTAVVGSLCHTHTISYVLKVIIANLQGVLS